MKKLFLTSGIIACMACPAFADPGFTPAQGAAAYDNQGDGSVAEACVEPTIGVYSGSTQLVAQWTNDFALMKLNDNNGNTEASGGATSHDWDTGSTSIWTTSDLYITGLTNQSGDPAAGKVVYKKDANDNFNLQALGASVVSVPTGAIVKYTVTTTLPQGATGSASTITSTEPTRPFRGYFDSTATFETSNDLAYIDSTGAVTSRGVNANYDNASPWKALYGYASPDLSGDPTAYGYAFQGWVIGGDTEHIKSTADVNNSNRTESTTAVAQWQAKVWDVTFNCGTGTITNAPSATTWTFDSTFTVPANADATGCGKAGSHFTGWQCKQGNNVVYEPEQTISNGSATAMTSASLTASVYASLVDDVANPQSGMTTENTNDIVCTAQYTANTIGLSWTDSIDSTTYEGGISCTYGNSVVLPENPTKTGYIFNGWSVGTTTPDTNLANQ